MPNTMTKIATITTGGGLSTTNVQFVSIPASFTDLILTISARTSRAVAESGVSININDDGGNNYFKRVLYGTGSSVGSYSGSNESSFFAPNIPGSSNTTNTFGNASLYIPNYLATTAKSILVDSLFENNATAANQYLTAGLWSGTSPINKIVIYEGTGNVFVDGSTFSLYGILKGSGGATVA